MFLIYEIHCEATSMSYIGSTKNLSSRKSRHFRSLERGSHHSPKLQNAYNKYGVGSFIFRILEKGVELADVFKQENFWIERKNSIKNGYNCVRAGQIHLGYKGNKPTTKSVISYNPTTEEINFYSSIVEAGRLGDNPKKGNIAHCLRKNTKNYCQGKFWFYSDEFNEEILQSKINLLNKKREFSEDHKRKIGLAHRGIKKSEEAIENNRRAQLGKDGTAVRRSDGRVYQSMAEAARDTGCGKGSIKRVVDGDRKRTRGFSFERIEKQSVPNLVD